MKNLFLTGLLALLGTGAFAQTTAGNISVGGSVSINTLSNEFQNGENKGSFFTLAPSVGYFIKDGLELGMNTRLAFGSSTTQNEGSTSEYKLRTFVYSVGPYLTKYVPVTEKLHFTASGGLGYENSRTKIPDENEELVSTSSGYYLSAAPGLTYFATEKLGFSIYIGSIRYSKSTETDEQTEPKNETVSKGFNVDLTPGSASIGIRYYINR